MEAMLMVMLYVFNWGASLTWSMLIIVFWDILRHIEIQAHQASIQCHASVPFETTSENE